MVPVFFLNLFTTLPNHNTPDNELPVMARGATERELLMVSGKRETFITGLSTEFGKLLSGPETAIAQSV